MFSDQMVLLTQNSTFIIGPIAQLFGTIMDTIYNIASNMGIKSLGISIIVFTLIVRTLMLPLAFKQQKSMKEMQKVQPELKKIQDKYKNKKDPESQQKYQMEMNKLYKDHGVSPFGGCLPVLVQFPIIMALFQVLRNLPAYITSVGQIYEKIVNVVVPVEGSEAILAEWADKLVVKNFDINNVQKVIDVIAKFSSDQWVTFTDQFSSVANMITPSLDKITEMYMFLGVNLADKPDLLSIGVLLPILNVVVQFLVMKSSSTATTAEQNPTQKSMMYTMPLITAFFVATMPSGLGLYWLASSVFQWVQQVVINSHLNDKEK
jgi:YidC/Oxa1 family membrane protein insertase